MIYILKWLFFSCGPDEVLCVNVCVCWSVEEPIMAWGLCVKSQGNQATFNLCYWMAASVNPPQIYWFFPVSHVTMMTEWCTQLSFVLLGWHMLHFAPPFHDLPLSIPYSFPFPYSSAQFFGDLHLSLVFWIYILTAIIYLCLYICANLILVTLTLMCVINSACVYTLPLPLMYCIVCGSHVHIW